MLNLTFTVNFFIPLSQSANLPGHEVWRKQFHQQNCTHFYEHTWPEVIPRYYTLLNISGYLLAIELLVKYWWNLPLCSSILQTLSIFLVYLHSLRNFCKFRETDENSKIKFLNKNEEVGKSVEGLIHIRHFGGQYCDKKIFLSHRYL